MDVIKVTEAKYIEGYKIKFVFNDGKSKIIDFTDNLWGDVFEPLRDISLFKRFKLNPFTIEWENGADFAPEFLYDFGEVGEDATSVSYPIKKWVYISYLRSSQEATILFKYQAIYT